MDLVIDIIFKNFLFRRKFYEKEIYSPCHSGYVYGGKYKMCIRDRIKDGRSVKYLMPKEAEKYIIEHDLYKEG